MVTQQKALEARVASLELELELCKKAIVAGNGGNLAPARRKVRAPEPKSYEGARGARESRAKGGRQSPQTTEDEHSEGECYLCNGPHMDMMSILGSHPCTWSPGVREHPFKGRFSKYLATSCKQSTRKYQPIFSSTMDDGADSADSSEGIGKDGSSEDETEAVNSEMLRENLERIVGADDSAFSGIDLATLIRNKYGRSYDVQLIKKEFMGRNLLALNVMWKYMEQRSFPLTEEEYLLRLDDVANTLKCWGAVSHIRNSLAKLKERPRIGKAVSIFIDMDESGGRANEWIYK
ncbi:unnamed protein product [Camellia sinensis]